MYFLNRGKDSVVASVIKDYYSLSSSLHVGSVVVFPKVSRIIIHWVSASV